MMSESPRGDGVHALPASFRVARKLRGRKQRRVFLRTIVAAGTAVATGGGLAWWLQPPAEPSFGGLTCSDIHQLAPAYAKNRWMIPYTSACGSISSCAPDADRGPKPLASRRDPR